jgi:hypothetical protein
VIWGKSFAQLLRAATQTIACYVVKFGIQFIIQPASFPVSFQAFLYVDRQFKDVMRRTKDRPNAMLVGMYAVYRQDPG